MNELRVGFLGLGVMGSSMAANLLKANFSVSVWNRSSGHREKLGSAGATVCESPRDVAARSNVLCTCVADGAAVRDVLFGSEGAASELPKGSLVIDFSTISPLEARAIGDELSTLGIEFLDAPVSGGDLGARNGTLTIMAGGSQSAFDSARPVFEAIGKRATRFGPCGAGQLMKSVNQIAVAIGVVAMTEAMEFAKAAGLEMDEVLTTLGGGAAGSWSIANYAPRIQKGDLDPGFSAKHMLKDLRIVEDEARTLGIELPGLALTARLYQELNERGFGGLGNHALLKRYS